MYLLKFMNKQTCGTSTFARIFRTFILSLVCGLRPLTALDVTLSIPYAPDVGIAVRQ